MMKLRGLVVVVLVVVSLLQANGQWVPVKKDQWGTRSLLKIWMNLIHLIWET